jgi:hypothetical protein
MKKVSVSRTLHALIKRWKMKTPVRLFLYGNLHRSARQGGRHLPIELDLQTPLPLSRVLARIGLPLKHVQLVMVNHRAVPTDVVVRPNDRVSLFPKEYPIFADWKDLRN